MSEGEDMDRALVLGGNSGIGLAITLELIKRKDQVIVCGIQPPNIREIPEEMRGLFQRKVVFHYIDLNEEAYQIFDGFQDINTLIITAGFGRVAPVENLHQAEIRNLFRVNALGAIQVLTKYMGKMKSTVPFLCAVLVSIAGHVNSPLFSAYGASKAALASFIQSVNAEIKAEGYQNAILDVSPGHIAGTPFHGNRTDIGQLQNLASEILYHMECRDLLFIPKYDEIYKDVLKRNLDDPVKFGVESYQYKVQKGVPINKSQLTIGFLSGTFDLFHIGHLNLLRNAKRQCDYLIVSVHENGSWKGKESFIPYEERVAIVRSIKFVDEVVPDYREDIDAWEEFHYQKLFVGSDYQGTERFKRYEAFFKDKDVQIVYFPYTKGTSSTQLREKLRNNPHE